MTLSPCEKVRAQALLKQHLTSLISSSQNSAKYLEGLAMLLVQVDDVKTAQDVARLIIKLSTDSDQLSVDSFAVIRIVTQNADDESLADSQSQVGQLRGGITLA